MKANVHRVARNEFDTTFMLTFISNVCNIHVYSSMGGDSMITKYIDSAMRRAIYEKLEDGTYWGEIPLCPGTNACKPTLLECQDELRSVLEDWILLSLQDGDVLPVIDGIDLNRRHQDEPEVVSV